MKRPKCKATGKRSYTSHYAADRVRKRMPEAAVLHIYRCPQCGQLHIGHIKGWRRLPTTS